MAIAAAGRDAEPGGQLVDVEVALRRVHHQLEGCVVGQRRCRAVQVEEHDGREERLATV